MSQLTRRSLVAGGTAAAIALALRLPAWAATADVYRRAIVIDGLGGLGNSETDGSLMDDAASGHPELRAHLRAPDDAAGRHHAAGRGLRGSGDQHRPDGIGDRQPSRVLGPHPHGGRHCGGQAGRAHGSHLWFPGRRHLRNRPVAARRSVSPGTSHRAADLQPPEPAGRRLPRARERGTQPGRRRGRREDERDRDPGGPQSLRPPDGRWMRSRPRPSRSPSPTPAAPRRTITRATARTRNCAPWRRRAASRGSTSCRS